MKITPYKSGSLKEICALSLPLMLSCLSSYLTMFIDRCFLTCYSLEALNATVHSSNLCWGFLGGASAMAAMAEVFVAQYNSAGYQNRIGEAVWQMIWFSFFCALFFIPLGVWGPSFFYPQSPAEAVYFRWIMCFGAFQPLSYALTTFFVGRGKTKWILLLTLYTILLNAGLNFALIFGVKHLIPSLGVKGSAIANCITLSCQVLILFGFFLRKKYREKYGTSQWRFEPKLFFKSCRITLPPAILYNIELISWSIFYTLMTEAGHIPITISSLCQSLILLFSFFGDGLSRGASILANHYTGLRKPSVVNAVFKSAVKVLLVFFGLQVIILGANPHFFIESFLLSSEELITITREWKFCVLCVLLFILFQNFQWVLASFLYAKGEAFFAMTAGSISILGILILPLSLTTSRSGFSVQWAWGLVVLYSFIGSLAYYLRYRRHTETSSSILEQVF